MKDPVRQRLADELRELYLEPGEDYRSCSKKREPCILARLKPGGLKACFGAFGSLVWYHPEAIRAT